MNPTVKDVAGIIEDFAPLALQEEYDNCGLNIGSYEAEVTGIVLCVDVTGAVLDEALDQGANLVVSHHPLLFHPLRQLVDGDPVQRLSARAVRENISLYAAHTNLDSAPGGLSFRLGARLGLQDMQPLAPKAGFPGAGLGVVGMLPEPRLPEEYLREVRATLRLGALRHSPLGPGKIQRVALCTGSGGSLLEEALASGADLYLCADLRYNHFFGSSGTMAVADVGHFESEYGAIDLLHDIISEKIATFALYKSGRSGNPVHYLTP